jgi:hypothetical protein
MGRPSDNGSCHPQCCGSRAGRYRKAPSGRRGGQPAAAGERVRAASRGSPRGMKCVASRRCCGPGAWVDPFCLSAAGLGTGSDCGSGEKLCSGSPSRWPNGTHCQGATCTR